MSVQSVKSKKAAGRSSISPTVVGIAAAVLVLFIGWLAYANLFAPPKAAPMDAKAQANHDYIKQLAVKSGGDVSKLSPDEQQKLRSIAGGYGAMAMRTILKEK